MATSLNTHDTLRIAVEACVHPRTVTRAYRGQPIRSTTAARIKQAAAKLGFAVPQIVLADASGAAQK